MDIGQLLFEQTKLNAKEYMEGKPLSIPTEEQLREVLTNPATYEAKGEAL